MSDSHLVAATMKLRYKVRAYPTPAQERALAKAFGCARVVYNDALRLRQQALAAGLPYPTDGDLSRQVITVAKTTPERAWLGEVPAAVLQQSLADLNTAYRNFFASMSGKRTGRRVGAPRFRSRKDSRQAIRYTRNTRFKVLPNGRLRLSKVGNLVLHWSRPLPSTPSSVTIIKDPAGRYFASFVVEVAAEPLRPVDSKPEAEVGLDLGLTHFAVLSDGTKVATPRLLRRAERKLRRLQQALSRKQRGSANRKKAVATVARTHARVADARRDFHHKLSTTIIRDNQAVYVEDLAVSALARTRLAKSVYDAGWASFTSMLEYKATRYGRTVHRIDRWYPSTRRCSACGTVTEKKALVVRSWICACGAVHDRDVNAALNILAAGRAERRNACGDDVSPRLAGAVVFEAGTHPEVVASRGGLARVPALQGGEDVNRRRAGKKQPDMRCAITANASQHVAWTETDTCAETLTTQEAGHLAIGDELASSTGLRTVLLRTSNGERRRVSGAVR